LLLLLRRRRQQQLLGLLLVGKQPGLRMWLQHSLLLQWLLPVVLVLPRLLPVLLLQ
jgi:hypothetical protein